MKTTYIKGFAMMAVGASMIACDDNAWNDHLDGFDGNPTVTDVKTIEYTLSDDDYSSIANNATNKSLAAAADLANDLKAVGTQHYFTDEITAAKYAPAFLASTSFPYFTLDNGSAVKLTYNYITALPEQVTKYAAADLYTLDSNNYIEVWGSDEDYIDGFAPSKPASSNLWKVLNAQYPEAEAGQCVIVSYQETAQEPVFGGNTETITYAPTTTVAEGTYLIVADGQWAGVTVAADKTYGYLNVLEITPDKDSGKIVGLPTDGETAEFTLKAATGGYYLIDCYERYLYQTKYDSFNFTTDLPESGGVWTFEAQEDGTMKIINADAQKYVQYSANYTSFGSYATEKGTLPVLYVKSVPASKAPMAQVPFTTVNALYTYNGKSWSQPSDAVVLQPADYTAMGQKYANLSNDTPALLLPDFLKQKFPYAQAEASKFVLYQYYNGSATAYRCDNYVYDGTAWTLNKGIETETSQFVRNNGSWTYDPSVVLTLPAGKGETFSATYYQACVDWVFVNIDKPLGSTSITSGMGYVTSYGNNEYYSGTSAYQNNVDIRPDAAKNQYPEGYEGMSDDQIKELMMTRLCTQVFPGMLKSLHSDAVPVDGVQVLYTINFTVYDGSSTAQTVRYEVTGPAKFDFLDCTWWEGGKPAAN